MTRRTIIFLDEFGNVYITPEFNGDKTEFEKFGSSDSCDKDWAEIEAVFWGVNTLEQFRAASEKAQGFYHSNFSDKQILPIFPVVCPNIMNVRGITRYIFVKDAGV
ncbi:hypothetical protein FACS1894137_14110 [Spirochaetia bacterium]|nr:hypothetical protein FACS1894137_14110 [Spirochaetia bacterium]